MLFNSGFKVLIKTIDTKIKEDSNKYLTFRVNASQMYYNIQGDSKRWTQTAYLLKLVIPTTNALPRWRLNVETKTKRTLHSSRRLSFNELTNAKILCCIVAILLSTDAAARLWARRGL